MSYDIPINPAFLVDLLRPHAAVEVNLMSMSNASLVNFADIRMEVPRLPEPATLVLLALVATSLIVSSKYRATVKLS